MKNYHQFANHLLHKLSIDDDEQVFEYLEFIKSSFKNRTLRLRKEFPLWRAQIATGTRNHEEYGEILAPCDRDRMYPVENKSRSGRINPPGKVCLYLATKEETAIHEVRPRIGDWLSLGLFEVSKDLKIIDCSKLQGKSYTEPLLKNTFISPGREWQFKELSEDQVLEKEWIQIDNAFSKPISSFEDKEDKEENLQSYISTQRIADFIKSQSYDGIAYKSIFGDGFNIALFNVNSALLRYCSLFEVTNSKVSYNQTGEAYWININNT